MSKDIGYRFVMNNSLDCIPCFIRQALEACRFVTDDPAVHEQVVREVLLLAAEMDHAQCPPVIGQKIHRRLRQITGIEDPYRAVKDRSNKMILDMTNNLKKRVESSPNRFAMAVRLAIAGNVIDYAVNGCPDEMELRRAVEQSIGAPLRGDINIFRQAVAEADSILYLADNAGEIVFDRLLIEQLPMERVTLAVRGAPVINDATRIDAQTADLNELVKVIDNGSDAPGTIVPDCSPAFQKRFDQADLVIAKGQGNFETLCNIPKNIFFLFKVKCPFIGQRIGENVGGLMLYRNKISSPTGCHRKIKRIRYIRRTTTKSTVG